MKKSIVVILGLLIGVLFLAAQKFPETCQELADFYGCRTQHKTRRHNTWLQYWNNMQPELKTAFAYDTVACYAKHQLCQRAIDNLAQIRGEFTAAYNRHPNIRMPMLDIVNGEFLYTDKIVAAVVSAQGAKNQQAIKQLLSHSSSAGKSAGAKMADKKALVAFIKQQDMGLVKELMMQLLTNQSTITQDTSLLAYIAYAARLSNEGLGPDSLVLAGADRTLLQAAKELVWRDPRQSASAPKALEKAGYTLTLFISQANQGSALMTLLNTLREGMRVEFTISASQVSALSAAAIDVALPFGVLILGADMVYQAIQENHVGKYMQALRTEGITISRQEIQVINKLLDDVTAQVVGAESIAEMTSDEIQQLMAGAMAMEALLTQVGDKSRTLEMADTGVKDHITCQYKQTAPQEENIPLSKLRDYVLISDPYTAPHLELIYNTLTTAGLCRGNYPTVQDNEKLFFTDCKGTLSDLSRFFPTDAEELRQVLKVSSSFYATSGTPAFVRAVYSFLPSSGRHWIAQAEVTLGFRNISDLKRVFGQIPKDILKGIGGQFSHIIRPERPQIGRPYFRVTAHELSKLKADPRKIPQWLLQYYFPEQSPAYGNSWNWIKIMRHIHYEELREYPKGYYICNHALVYPMEFYKDYPEQEIKRNVQK